MRSTASDLLFYTGHGSAPQGWSETIAAVQDTKDYPVVSDLIRQMVTFATEFSLSGNIWHYWLTYMLMMHENAFS